jgi:hypothetical protein
VVEWRERPSDGVVFREADPGVGLPELVVPMCRLPSRRADDVPDEHGPPFPEIRMVEARMSPEVARDHPESVSAARKERLGGVRTAEDEDAAMAVCLQVAVELLTKLLIFSSEDVCVHNAPPVQKYLNRNILKRKHSPCGPCFLVWRLFRRFVESDQGYGSLQLRAL